MTPHVGVARFSRSLLMSAAMVVLLAIALALYVRSETLGDRANELRHRSLLLADELRQSGDDLTRMVRTYVATGDPVYKQHFQDILDIRDGKKPRPENYSRPYWDLVLPGGPAPRPESPQPVALLELMRQAGFTEEEFRKLAEAKANSDALTIPELMAMKLIESPGPDAEATRARAARMLYDDTYHQAKAAVMKPIHDFLVLVDRRTLAAIQTAETQDRDLQYVFVAIGLGLVFSLWRTYATLRETLGGGLDEVHAQIARIGGGDPSAAITLREGLENSVLGWLSATQARLNDRACERKRAEEALQESEEKYRLIADNTDDWVYWLAPDENLRYVSPSCERVTGYSAAEFTDHPQLIRAIVHPEAEEMFLRHLEKAREPNESDYLEYRITTKTGDVRWISHSCGPIYTREGLYAGRQGTNRNITARKQAEEALRRSEQRLRRFYEAGLIGVVYWTIHGRITDANDKFLELIGYSREDLEAGLVDWNDLTPPEDRQLDDASIAELRATGASKTPVEKEYIRKDGTRITVLLAGTMLDEARNDGVAFVLDITERKQAEALMIEQLDELRRWHQATLGREGRVIELKKEINDLLARAGQSPRYPSVSGNGGQ